MSDQKYVFEKLTPINDAKIDVYESAIDFVFANEDVRNVAISGTYGSGKSSVLNSYKKNHTDLNFVHISLAHFQLHDEPSSSTITESVLEGKILNHLIHQIPANNIPQTNFRVKRPVSWKMLTLVSISTVVFFFSILQIILFEKWGTFINSMPNNLFQTITKNTAHPNSLIFSGLIVSVLSGCFIYHLIKAQKNRNIFRKLNIQGTEIDFFNDCDDSCFDKYLNEVLYLFERVNADVIVFEDMDRFDARPIFERLREINTLVNIQLKKESKNILRFFYLLRDDIFVSKDRKKFFDFIIPVIPVVDSSNSYNQFISHLKKNNLYEKFDDVFLKGLSLYVDDMRLLQNICNEFLIYFNRLNTTELNYNKMLAIITYKNLFPRDFSELQLNYGLVYTLFSNKDEYIKSAKNNLEAQIKAKKSEITDVENEQLESVQELEDVYKGKQSRVSNPNYQREQKNKEDLKQWYESEYPKRKKAIEEKIDDRISSLEKELSDLKHDLSLLSTTPLEAIITSEHINNVTVKSQMEIERKFSEIKDSIYFDLLKYLVCNGYIDETYSDYMTYFYPESLSTVDKTFLRSVTDKKAKEYTYELKDPKKVLTYLRAFDFEQKETLNFSLFDYLLKNHATSDYVSHLISQLQISNDFKFVGEYLDYTIESPTLINVLNSQWPSLFETALKANYLTTDQLRLYSVLTLYYSDPKTIIHVNADNCFTEYIASSADYLNIDLPDTVKLISGFKLLDIYFCKIDYPTSNRQLFLDVYLNSLYAMNLENIGLA